MRFPFLTLPLIASVLVILAPNAHADRTKVALIDGEPVYHWSPFRSAVPDDIDRALILREFHRQGFNLPAHFVDEALRNTIKHDFGGVQSKLLADLKSHNETLSSYRNFISEEVIVQAMLARETKRPHNGHPPPTEAAWLASLRKGTKIQQIKPESFEGNDAGKAPSYTEAQADLLAQPLPEYPYVARRDLLQGNGLYLVQFDLNTGAASDASIVRSSGHAVLDQSALRALRQWRIKPHTYGKISVPYNFTISGDEAALLRAVGNNLLYAVPPNYPLAAGAHGVAGNGRFQLTIDPSSGLVTDIQTLQTTHDQRLDAAAVKAFRQWRFRPHTLQKLVVPADFNLGYG